MKTNIFGKTAQGKDVTEYVIENKNGMAIHLLDFGAILHRIYIPDLRVPIWKYMR